ncbi:MAG: rod shape-determining protein MreB [Clostridiales bacterium]|nr:rod shape-determining protein MreB [Clostridiales bacterium]
MAVFGYNDIGIDLGTSSVLVYVKGKGILLREPSVIAFERDTDKVLAVGEEARRMIGRTPGNITALKPMQDGVISDYEITLKMLRYFLRKAMGRTIFRRPRVVICVPSIVTEVEKRAVLDATYEAGARHTYLIEEPIAAAIGASIDISQPYGNMVVDVGGGTTDVAVISLGGAVVAESIRIAGETFDDYIALYMRKKHNILIGDRTSEIMKIEIGSAYKRDKIKTMLVTGRNLVSGLPKTVEITSDEMVEALEEPVQAIADTVHRVLERTPPELASDISEKGIIMTGGGALLYGLDKLIQERTKIAVYVFEDAMSSVAIGTGRALEDIDVYSKSIMSEYRRSALYQGR